MCKYMKKLLLLLLLIPNLVMGDNLTDETLDLMLDCKGDGNLHHFGDKTYTPFTSNETLHIKTDKYGRKNTLYFKESDWWCVTTTTEIRCFNQNYIQKNYEQKVKENPLMLRVGKIVINRLSGEAKLGVGYKNSSADSNVVCKKKVQKF